MDLSAGLPEGSSEATGINDAGEICGYRVDSHQARHAVLWRGGRVYGLGDGTAIAINNRRQIVGLSQDGTTGWIWSQGRRARLLPPEGARRLVPRAINASREVIGHLSPEPARPVPFLYSHGGISRLNMMKAVASFALGINDRGEIVGDWLTQNPIRLSAVVWRNGRPSELRRLVRPGDPRHDRIILESAAGVNNRGEIIARGYWTGKITVHAFLLRPLW